MAQLKRLFEPIKIGNMESKNRILMISMATGYGGEGGRPTERLKRFLVERAEGGTGLILTTTAPPDTTLGRGIELRDDLIPVWLELTKAIQANGAKMGAQINPALPKKNKNARMELLGPSAVVIRQGAPMPRSVTVDEIHQMVETCGDAARIAREAAFDFVEIQAGIGAIVNRFVSPVTNKREDEYGGSLENRVRFLLEITGNVKKKAGQDFTVTCKLCASDFVEGGYGLEDYKKVAVILEKAGVNLLNVQPGWHDSPVPLAQKEIPVGYWAYLSEGIKKVVKIPVACHYRFSDPVIAERVLAEGKADVIGMGRAHLSDPEFANKAREGRLDDIRHCICCMRCMDQVVARGEPLSVCSVNAKLGEDIEVPVEPAREPKKVCIIGGGPGGMEAARVAALRGHKVTLYDKGRRLGGAMLLGTVLRQENASLVNYLTGQLKKLNVDVKLGKEMTSDLIADTKPDVVILALGGAPLDYGIPGADGDNVLGFSDMSGLMSGQAPRKGGPGRKMAWRLACLYFRFSYGPSFIRWFLKFGLPFGKRVVIVGGSFAGCELAETLIEKGKKVTILEESNRIGTDVSPSERFIVMGKFRKAGVRMETNTKAVEISKKGIRVVRDGAEELIEADTVVLAKGLRPNKELAEQLKGKFPVVLAIGDCVDPQRIGEAVKAGFRAARNI